jgi:hypothetical protein
MMQDDHWALVSWISLIWYEVLRKLDMRMLYYSSQESRHQSFLRLKIGLSIIDI